MDKTNRQRKFGTPQHLFNSFVQAADAAKRRELGEPGESRDYQLPPLKLKNTSGGNLSVGRVLEIGASLLTPYDRRNLWFTGSTPAPDGTKGIAISLVPLVNNEIGRFQAFGICEAQVNINHEQQRYADVDSSSTLLQSKWHGRAEILQKESTGTGERTCLINLGPMFRGPIKVVLAEDIAPGGSGDAEVKWGASGAMASPTSTIEVLYDHMAGSQDATDGSDATVFWDLDEQAFMIYELECDG